MKTYGKLYEELTSFQNLFLAWKKAKKGKTKKNYVQRFEENVIEELLKLQNELKSKTYFPIKSKTFILRDPKIRKISKSNFRDRIVHHAICNVIEPIFEKVFIHDNCANRKGRGSLFALKQFDKYKRKVSYNLTKNAYCLKADIKHYFKEVNHEILLNLLGGRIKDDEVLNLISIILKRERDVGMPLGNLTSQFFANVYLNELDYFVKHRLKTKYYIRYVDDFILLHPSRKQLYVWKKEIKLFLKENLKLELHPDKSKIHYLSKGVDFIGFRNFYHYRLLRKRNVRSIKRKIELFSKNEISQDKISEIYQGWSAYANGANSHNIKKKLINLFSKSL